MTPATFEQANADYGPPPDLTESQCRTVPAYAGRVIGGSVDGTKIVVVAWRPDADEIARIAAGGPVFVSMLGGLAPHFLTTTFEQATNPA